MAQGPHKLECEVIEGCEHLPDGWSVQRLRCMTRETIAPMGDDLTPMVPAAAA